MTREKTKKAKSLLELLDSYRKNAELEASGVTKTTPEWWKRINIVRRYLK